MKLSMGDEEGYTTADKWEELKRFATGGAHDASSAEPLSPGLEMEALRARLPYEISARNYRALVDRLARETDIVREESTLRLKSHRVKLGGDDGQARRAASRRLHKRRVSSLPNLKQLAEALKLPLSELAQMRSAARRARARGQGREDRDRSLFRARINRGRAPALSLDYLKTAPEITAATYRDLLGASRKFAIALLDYFDHSGVTTRVGDARKLRARP